MELLLCLGSNLGDRRSNLEKAERLLSQSLGSPVKKSNILETKALGFDGKDFLNSLVAFESSLSPEDALALCKAIERRMGRLDAPVYDNEGNRIYCDRIIDIDILTYGDLHLDSPMLTIPHPALNVRPFIKELLLNLRPL